MICAHCGTTFERYAPPGKPAPKYCSRVCNGARLRAPHPCDFCGKPIPGLKSRQKRCSRECFNAARFAGTVQRCAVCDAEVRIPQHRRGKSAYFCSAEHANVWQGRSKTSHVCKVCGVEFRRSASLSKAHPVTYCSIACRDEDPAQRDRLLAMSQLQSLGAPTSIERAGYGMLAALGVAFIPQHPIGRFVVDAFVPDHNLVVQFDGDYWHFNPAVFLTPDARQQKRIRSDKACAAYMAARGHRMLRLWETDIRKRPEWVMEQLFLHCVTPEKSGPNTDTSFGTAPSRIAAVSQ